MSDEDDTDLRAAEYALGALEPDEARLVEAEAARSQVLRDAIADWEDRLAPLGDAVVPIPPPHQLWARLALATGLVAERRDPPARRVGVATRAWRSPALWRAATAGALALAASLAYVAFLPTEPRIAALTATGSPPPTFLVRTQPNGQATIMALTPPSVAAGRDLELWSLPAGATRPASLGVLPPEGRSLRLAVPPGTQLLVSLEPKGGSPTGQPTGPVLYAGVLTSVR